MMAQEYTVFFPLTRNTNVLNINAAAAAVANSSVTDVAYFTAPYDCNYNKLSAGMSARWGLPHNHDRSKIICVQRSASGWDVFCLHLLRALKVCTQQPPQV